MPFTRTVSCCRVRLTWGPQTGSCPRRALGQATCWARSRWAGPSGPVSSTSFRDLGRVPWVLGSEDVCFGDPDPSCWKMPKLLLALFLVTCLKCPPALPYSEMPGGTLISNDSDVVRWEGTGDVSPCARNSAKFLVFVITYSL